jgi:hypothetical protein
MMSLWLRSGASPLSAWRRAIWKQKKALIGFLGALGSFFLFAFLSGTIVICTVCATGCEWAALAFLGAGVATSTKKRVVIYKFLIKVG